MDEREVINRIQRMEEIFDLLQKGTSPKEELASMRRELIEYYESPLWREDYERDERRELPEGLKRGVLSEDGVYNYLSGTDGI